MIIRLKEEIKSVCGAYIAAKGEELEVSSYDEILAIYHCNKKVIGFACDNKIRYEVCKESAEVVASDNMKSPDDWVMTEQEKPSGDGVLDQFQYNDEGKLEPINKDLLKDVKQLTSMDIPVEAFEISSGPGSDSQPPSKYHRENTLRDKDFVDFYDIINLLQSSGEQIPPEIQHALKKLMYNDRGHKNMVQDKKEAVWSVNRWLENNEL